MGEVVLFFMDTAYGHGKQVRLTALLPEAAGILEESITTSRFVSVSFPDGYWKAGNAFYCKRGPAGRDGFETNLTSCRMVRIEEYWSGPHGWPESVKVFVEAQAFQHSY
jgi:hypothetical protein